MAVAQLAPLLQLPIPVKLTRTIGSGSCEVRGTIPSPPLAPHDSCAGPGAGIGLPYGNYQQVTRSGLISTARRVLYAARDSPGWGPDASSPCGRERGVLTFVCVTSCVARQLPTSASIALVGMFVLASPRLENGIVTTSKAFCCET